MRDRLTTAAEAVGAGCLVTAGFLIVPALGLALLGAALIAAGYFMGRDA